MTIVATRPLCAVDRCCKSYWLRVILIRGHELRPQSLGDHELECKLPSMLRSILGKRRQFNARRWTATTQVVTMHTARLRER